MIYAGYAGSHPYRHRRDCMFEDRPTRRKAHCLQKALQICIPLFEFTHLILQDRSLVEEACVPMVYCQSKTVYQERLTTLNPSGIGEEESLLAR